MESLFSFEAGVPFVVSDAAAGSATPLLVCASSFVVVGWSSGIMCGLFWTLLRGVLCFSTTDDASLPSGTSRLPRGANFRAPSPTAVGLVWIGNLVCGGSLDRSRR